MDLKKKRKHSYRKSNARHAKRKGTRSIGLSPFLLRSLCHDQELMQQEETLTLLTQTHQYHYHIKTTSCSWDGPSKPFPNLSKFGRFQCIAFFMPRMHHFQVFSFVVFGCFRSHRFRPRHWQVTSADVMISYSFEYRKFPEVSRDWTQQTRPFMRSPFPSTLTQALITNSRVEHWGFWHLKRAKLLPPLAP